MILQTYSSNFFSILSFIVCPSIALPESAHLNLTFIETVNVKCLTWQMPWVRWWWLTRLLTMWLQLHWPRATIPQSWWQSWSQPWQPPLHTGTDGTCRVTGTGPQWVVQWWTWCWWWRRPCCRRRPSWCQRSRDSSAGGGNMTAWCRSTGWGWWQGCPVWSHMTSAPWWWWSPQLSKMKNWKHCTGDPEKRWCNCRSQMAKICWGRIFQTLKLQIVFLQLQVISQWNMEMTRGCR